MIKSLTKKFPIIKSNPYLATFFGVSLTAFVFGSLLFVFVYFLPNTEIVKAEESEWVPPSGKSLMEVHIANNGMVFLQGAFVESISGTTIIASTSWNEVKMQWIIHTNGSDYGVRHFGTSFLDSKGNKITVKDIRVGEIISINGVFDLAQTGFTVKADVIRISL